MKKVYQCSSPAFILAVVLVLVSTLVSAQTVNVTMRVNTSTCLDTLRSTHVVLMEGASIKGTTPAITWDNKSGISATNVGGDYWEAKFQAMPGDTLQYKFVTYFDLAHPTFHWSGWEGPIDAGIPSGGNRMFIVGANDTTLPVQYFNGWESTVAQYWRPFASKTDSIAVYFRVNMGGVVFSPATQIPLAKGGAPMGADPTWVTIVTMTRETNSINSGSFWSGVAYIPKAGLTANTQQQFKFVINSPETWESTGNRSFRFTANVIAAGDTTLAWAYFNNQPPHGAAINATLNFRLRLDALEKAGLFNRGLGDKVAVTGAKGWPPSTFAFDTEPSMLKMTYVPSIKEWVLSEPFSLFEASQIIYKYYIAFDSSRVDTANKNYTPGLRLTDGWEEPGVMGGGNRSYTYGTASDQTVAGDFGAQQQFFNSLHPNSVITTPITVKFAIDMSPAASATTNPTNALFRPGVDTVYVQFDGCLIPITQGKSMYGTDNRLMLVDSTGTGVYKGSLALKAPTFFQVCYRIVYTSPGGEVSNGGGTNSGRRYYQYIAPTSITGGTITWPGTFTLATMTWSPGADLTVENPPDLGPVTAIDSKGQEKPLAFALFQNYPNPFNPSTVISYAVAKTTHVTLDVFDILGQKVASLVDEQQDAGTHAVSWNARNAHGASVGSGVYFVRMQAGDFSHVTKMVLTR